MNCQAAYIKGKLSSRKCKTQFNSGDRLIRLVEKKSNKQPSQGTSSNAERPRAVSKRFVETIFCPLLVLQETGSHLLLLRRWDPHADIILWCRIKPVCAFL